MRIGELGQATGVDVETIRYYEKEGLLPPPARAANGYRAYGAAHLERLSFVRHCRGLDMSLAEIRHLLDFTTRPEADCGEINRLIDAHLGRVRARLKSLHTLEKQLVALRAAQPGTSPQTAAFCTNWWPPPMARRAHAIRRGKGIQR